MSSENEGIAQPISALDEERRAATSGALIHVRPDLGVFVVTGRERLAWLNGLVTCDLSGLLPGSGAYGLAVGKTGKILDELWFVADDEDVLVISAGARQGTLRDHLDHHLIMEDAEMSDVLARDVIFTHGPGSRDLVGASRALGASAAMVNWTGRGDAAIVVPQEGQLDAVKSALLARAGHPLAVASDAGWEAIRIQWGVPRFGIDFDTETVPHEASLENVAVSFKKGCYLGQEAVFMLEQRGHAKKRLMRIEVEGREPVPSGAELLLEADGTAVGLVTSATPHPSGAHQMSLGYVKFKHAIANTALTAAGRRAHAVGLAAPVLTGR